MENVHEAVCPDASVATHVTCCVPLATARVPRDGPEARVRAGGPQLSHATGGAYAMIALRASSSVGGHAE